MHSKSEVSCFKQLVHPIEQDISYFRKTGKRTEEAARGKEPSPILEEEQDHFSIIRWHILVNVFQPKMTLSFKA